MDIEFTLQKRGYQVEWSDIERKMKDEINDAIRVHPPKTQLTFRVRLELVEDV